MKTTNWTTSQKQAIEQRGKNLLVSAGAGSGKTSVMIARIVDLIVSFKEPISNFLVVTFTKASASDMKNKLIRELEKNATDSFVLSQIEEVGTSDVSNLHSFCARLLKQYFYQIGLDPSFVVLDEEQMQVLKQKAIDKLFGECIKNNDKEMLELADILNKNRSELALSEAIIRLREFMLSQIDGKAWFNDCIKKCYDPDFETNVCARFLNGEMVDIFENAKQKFLMGFNKAQEFGDEKLSAYAQNLYSIASLVSKNSSVKANINAIFNLPSFGQIPRKVVSGAETIKEEISKAKDEFSKQIKNIQNWWGEDDPDKILMHNKENLARVKTLFRLALRFDEILADFKGVKGGLDFSDLEQYALKALSLDEVRDELRQKYKYVFVDEYQDINPVQEKILTLVSNENNRFMVGDIKQSIYRFRLCNPEIFLEKFNSYKKDESKGQVIELKENFRSANCILKFCNYIFSKCYTKSFGGIDYNPDGLLLSLNEGEGFADKFSGVDFNFIETKALKESLKPNEAQDCLVLYSVANHEQEASEEASIARAEASVVAKKISEIVGQRFKTKNGVEEILTYKDIVILLASRGEYLKEFMEALGAFGIPISSDLSQDIFEDEYILCLYNLLRVVDNFAQDYPLANLLKSPLFNFSLNELAQIKLNNPNSKFFYQAVKEAINLKNLPQKLQNKLNNFYEIVLRYKKMSGFLSAKELVTKIINETKFELIVCASPDSTQTKLRLAKFMQSLTQSSLSAFILDIENCLISCQAVPDGDSVRIMTIHSSKGLEFPVVFLVNCGKEFSTKSGSGDLLISKDLGVGIKYYNSTKRFMCENFVRTAIKINEGYKIKEEQLRLLYVALTRAVNQLVVVGSGEIESFNDFKKPSNATSFLDWFAPCLFDKLDGINALQGIAQINFYDALSESRAISKKPSRQVIFADPDQTLKNEIASVISKKFEFENLLKFPSKASVTTLNSQEVNNTVTLFEEHEGQSPELGTAYHKVLEALDFNNASVENVNNIISNLTENGVIKTEISKKINAQIINFIAQNKVIKDNLDGKFLKEKEFLMAYSPTKNNCNNDGDFMVVQGICDLVIIKNNQIILVDFKLSNKSAQKLKNDYAEQINLYKQALENSYNLPVSKKYICKLTTGEFIEM